jgi:hypothetical protein
MGDETMGCFVERDGEDDRHDPRRGCVEKLLIHCLKSCEIWK